MAYNLPGEHEFIRPDQFINLGLAALDLKSVLPRIFTRVNGDIFKGAPSGDQPGQLGQKINYRLNRVATPAQRYEWRTRENPIELGRIGTTTETIELDTHLVHGVPVTNEQFTFDVGRFATEIVEPQVTQIVEEAEGEVVTQLNAAPFAVTNANVAATADPYKYALSVRRKLNDQGTPQEGRVLLVGSNVEQWMLESDRLSKLSETGSTGALRRATLGDLAGMTVIASNAIDPNAIFAVHPSALLIANLAPELPPGVPYSARRTANGWSMLLTYQYESRWQQSVSVLSSYLGVNSVNDQLLYVDGKIAFDASGNPQTTGKNVRGLKGALSGFSG